MKNRIALVIIWIGKMPDFFELWKKTCLYNEDVDFLLYTDQEIDSDANLIVKKISIDSFNKRVRKTLGLNSNVKKPYKVCDFRPAFGHIFENDLKGYSYWGYCDIDMVFGRISNFIKPAIDGGYEKINHNGHLTIFKNTEKNRFLYKEKGAKFSYQKVFLSDEHYAFDEFSGIWSIAKYNNVKEFNTRDFVDLNRREKELSDNNGDNHKFQAFYWRDGRAYTIFQKKGKLVKHEKLYLHFQKRNPKVIDACSSFYQITTKEFRPLKNESEIVFTKRKVLKARIDRACYYKNRLKDFLAKGSGERIRWIRRKFTEF